MNCMITGLTRLKASRTFIVLLLEGLAAACFAQTATTTNLATISAGMAQSAVSAGSAVTLRAAVSVGSAPVRTGQVEFCDASAPYCTGIHLLGVAQLTNGGTASITLIPGTGSHSYQAVFLGTKSSAASSSGVVSLSVTGLYPSTSSISQAGNASGYSLTATVMGLAGKIAPTGIVSFLDASNANKVLGTASLGSGIAGLGWLNASNSVTGSYPVSLTVGDFNNDGVPDFAVPNAGDGTVTIFLGNGDGTFRNAAGSPIPVGQTPWAVTVGDFNADGNADLAVTNYSSDSVSILLGNGDGTFTQAANSPIVLPEYPMFLVTGDFNRDGIADLAIVATPGDYTNIGTLTVLLGNGDGTFTQGPDSPLSLSYDYALSTADFNDDGIPDLIVAGGGTAKVLLGNGDGSFTATSNPLAAGNSPVAVAIGDFNGDGIADLAICSWGSNAVVVLLGQGNGTFTQTSDNLVGVNPSSVGIADVNGDGLEDLVVTNEGSQSVSIFLGTGRGTFRQAAGSPLAFNGVPVSIVPADLNGDGIADFAVVDENGGAVTALLSQATETASTTVSGILPVGSGTHQIEVSYPSDGKYAASTSAAIPLQANPLPPSAAVTLSSSIITSAQTLTVTAVISGRNGSPTPTGTVALSGGYSSGPVTLKGGTAYFTIPAGSLSVGSDTLTASYTPDATGLLNYISVSTVVSVTVTTLAQPLVTVTPSASSISNTQALTVTVGVNGGPGAPTVTGTVTLSGGGYYSPAVTLNAGKAIISVPAGALAVGTDLLSAGYIPDAGSSSVYEANIGCASVAVTTSLELTPIVTVTPSPGVITTLQSTAVKVGVNGGTGNPQATGMAVVFGSQASSGIVPAIYDTFPYPDGTRLTNQPAQSGNSQWSWSGGGQPTIQGMHLTPIANAANFQYVSLANSSQVGATPDAVTAIGATFQLCLSPGSSSYAPSAISAALVAEHDTSLTSFLLLNFSPAGWFLAKQVSGGTFTSLASGTESLVVDCKTTYTVQMLVNPAAGTVQVIPPSGIASAVITDPDVTKVAAQFGTWVVGSGTTCGNCAYASIGSVWMGGGYVSPATVLSGGGASIAIPPGALPTGTDALTASYTPDSSSAQTYNGAMGTGSITVSKAVPTVTVSPSPASITTVQSDIVTVGVSGASGSPTGTGTVVLSGGGYSSGPVTLQSGLATLGIPAGSLPVGVDALKVNYAPDPSSAPIYSSASGNSTITVIQATPSVIVSPALPSITTQQSETVTVGVSGGSGTPTATGSVVLSGGGFTSNSAPLARGSATINVPAGSLAIGSDTLTATFIPDSSGATTYNGSSGSATVVVTSSNLYTPKVTVTPSPAIASIVQTITAPIRVTGNAGNFGPTGLVTLMSNNPAPMIYDSFQYPDGSLINGLTAQSGNSVWTVASSGIGVIMGNHLVNNAPPNELGVLYASLANTASLGGTPQSITSIGGTLRMCPSVTGTYDPTYTSVGLIASHELPLTNFIELGIGPTSWWLEKVVNGVQTFLYIGTENLAVDCATDYPVEILINQVAGTVQVIPPSGIPSAVITDPDVTAVNAMYGTWEPENNAPYKYIGKWGSVWMGGGYVSPSVVLSGGNASFSIPAGTLGLGTDMLTASYTPDAVSAPVYNAASGTGSVTVSRITPAISVTPSLSSLTVLQQLTVTVGVSGGAGSPAASGTVIVNGGGYTSSALTVQNGSASVVVPAGALGLGTDTLTASYTPDAVSAPVYNAASGTGSVTVSNLTPTVTVSPSPSSITTAQGTIVTVGVSGGAGSPTASGTVMLKGSQGVSVPAIYDTFPYANGTALTNQVAQSGTSRWSWTGGHGVGPVIQNMHLVPTANAGNFVYASLANTTALGGTPSPVTALGASFQLCLSPGSASYDGNQVSMALLAQHNTSLTSYLQLHFSPTWWELSKSVNGGPYTSIVRGTENLVVDCQTTYTVQMLLNQTGGTVQVIPPNGVPSAVFTDPDVTAVNALYGTWELGSGTTCSNCAAASVGSVWMGGGYVSPSAVLSGGSASFSIPAGTLGLGTDTLTASYTPDAVSAPVYNAAAGTGSATVSRITPAISVTPSLSSLTVLQQLTVTVGVSGGAGSPAASGTVIVNGGGYTSSALTVQNGSASVVVPAGALGLGTDTLTASYTPDAVSAPVYNAASGTGSVTVSNLTPTVTVSASPSSITTAQGTIVTVGVSGGAGSPAASGTVMLKGSQGVSVPAIYDTFQYSNGTALTNQVAQSGTSRWSWTGGHGVGPVIQNMHLVPTANAGNFVYASLANTTALGGTPSPVTALGASFQLCLSPGSTSYDGNQVSMALLAQHNTSLTSYLQLHFSPTWWELSKSVNGGPYTSIVRGTENLVVDCQTTYTVQMLLNQTGGTVQVIPPSGVPSAVFTDPDVTAVNALYGTWELGSGTTCSNCAAASVGSVWMGGGYVSPSAVLSGGNASFSIPAGTLGLGTDTLTASYTPDAVSAPVYNAASGTGSVTVSRITPAISVTPSLSSLTVLQQLTVTVGVSGGAGPPAASGTVIVSGGGYTSSALTVQSGSASVVVPAGALGLGTDTLTASYTPDAVSAPVYNAAAGTGSVTVSNLTPTVTVSPSPSSITTAQGTIVTVGVSGGAGSPAASGTVMLKGSQGVSVPAIYDTFPYANGTALTNQVAQSGTSRWSWTGGHGVGPVIQNMHLVPTANAGNFVYASLANTTALGGTPSPVTALGASFQLCLSPGSTSYDGNQVSMALLAQHNTSLTSYLQLHFSPTWWELSKSVNGGPYTSIVRGTENLVVDCQTTYTVQMLLNQTGGTVQVIPPSGVPSAVMTDPDVTAVNALYGTWELGSGTTCSNCAAASVGSVWMGGGYVSPSVVLSGGSASFSIPAGTLGLGTDMLTASYTPDAVSAPVYNAAAGTGSVTVSK